MLSSFITSGGREGTQMSESVLAFLFAFAKPVVEVHHEPNMFIQL